MKRQLDPPEDPSLRGIRVLNNYYRWHRVKGVVLFTFGVLILALMFQVFLLGLTSTWPGAWLFALLCVLVILASRPALLYHGVFKIPRWSGCFSRNEDRLTLHWKQFRIDFDLDRVVSATYLCWRDQLGLLVLDMDLGDRPGDDQGHYRGRRVKGSSHIVRCRLPLQGGGHEVVLPWIREFPGLKQKDLAGPDDPDDEP
jgi:hypothetical protein